MRERPVIRRKKHIKYTNILFFSQIYIYKVKALKGLSFCKEITKTEAQEVKPRIILKKNMIKGKQKFFQKVGQLQKNLKPS